MGVVLTKLLLDNATIQVDEKDDNGVPTGKSLRQLAFSHKIENTYDDKGKAWWKKYGMVTMNDALIHKLSEEEVCSVSAKLTIFCCSVLAISLLVQRQQH